MRVLRGGAALMAVLLLALSTMAQTGIYWPEGGSHNHRDHGQHASLGWNMEQVSYLPFGEAIGELDIAVDAAGRTWIVVALLSMSYTNGGFALVDATDPAQPKLVSTTRTGGYGADVKISADARTVYMSMHPGFGPHPLCNGGQILPTLERLTCGVQVWDVTVKTAPVFIATLPSSSFGSHMTDFKVMNGIPVLAMAAMGDHSGPVLAVGHVPIIVSRPATGFMHDMTLTTDPLDPARNLLVVANWDDGVRVFDITNPAQPSLLGRWAMPPGSGGRVHTVMMTEIEGRRVIVATQENAWQDVVSEAFFLDATDFANIQLLGTWGNPQGHRALQGFRWSTHNINILGDRLSMAHYHGGIVIFDISTLDNLANQVVLGNFVPTGLPTQDVVPFVHPGEYGTTHDHGGPDSHAEVPFTWDVMEHDGVFWLTDIYSGLYAVRLSG